MQNIPLNSLTVSESHNVRKTDRDKGLEELIASIRTHGLLENLLVIPGNDKKKFQVIAGGRRLLAMQALMKEGALSKNHQVPCELVDAASAEEISLAENMVRTPMHPADQYEAWAKLIDQGMSVADVAARFGISDTLVAKRLKLGKLSPELMAAYREDKLTLEVLMAFAITDDHQKQEEVYNRLKDSWSIKQASSIRDALTETMVSSNTRLARFVGVEAYEEAGGYVRRDLFSNSDMCYFEDVDLLHKLVDEKLQQQADLLQEQWKWVQARTELSYDEKAQYQQLFPHALGEIPADLIMRQQALEEQLNDLMENEADEEDAEPIEQELLDIRNQISAFHGYSAEDRAKAGCIITLNYSGDMVFIDGLIHPEDQEQLEAPVSENGTATTMTEKSAPPYSQSLTERLRDYRLQIVRQHMAKDYETAFDAALYLMCMKSFNNYYNGNWLQVQAEKYHFSSQMLSEDETAISLHQEEERQFANLSLAWLNIKDETERFQALCSLDASQKRQIFATCIARSLRPQLAIESSKSPLFELIGQRLNVSMSEHWRPTAKNFLERVTKKDLLEIGQSIFGDSWVQDNSKKPKCEVVTVLQGVFQNSEQKHFTQEQQVLIAEWLPKGMEFTPNV